ncbi:transcriptional regulator, AlpA family [Marinobacter pelagius]|uniref:Transcriptional regulator, AlpA family n=2 Tax=Marinobacter pelagius TaxID=379482 RepID=A0A1I4QNN3_9GAMM|nr:transcriptional regulator, AlpA family [Marinobacter pelagius]
MFYTIDEVSSRYKVSTKTIWRWVREGRFPRPVKVGPGTTRWREEDLQAFEEGLQ